MTVGAFVESETSLLETQRRNQSIDLRLCHVPEIQKVDAALAISPVKQKEFYRYLSTPQITNLKASNVSNVEAVDWNWLRARKLRSEGRSYGEQERDFIVVNWVAPPLRVIGPRPQGCRSQGKFRAENFASKFMT